MPSPPGQASGRLTGSEVHITRPREALKPTEMGWPILIAKVSFTCSIITWLAVTVVTTRIIIIIITIVIVIVRIMIIVIIIIIMIIVIIVIAMLVWPFAARRMVFGNVVQDTEMPKVPLAYVILYHITLCYQSIVYYMT